MSIQFVYPPDIEATAARAEDRLRRTAEALKLVHGQGELPAIGWDVYRLNAALVLRPAVGLTIRLTTSSNERFGEPGVDVHVESLAPPPVIDQTTGTPEVEQFTRWRLLGQAMRAMRSQTKTTPRELR